MDDYRCYLADADRLLERVSQISGNKYDSWIIGCSLNATIGPESMQLQMQSFINDDQHPEAVLGDIKKSCIELYEVFHAYLHVMIEGQSELSRTRPQPANFEEEKRFLEELQSKARRNMETTKNIFKVFKQMQVESKQLR